MKQTRIIRIFFLAAAVFVVASFWAGFYFGENSTHPENILIASEGENNASTVEKPDTTNPVPKQAETQKEEEEAEQTIESMKDIEEERYYLKLEEEYLVVYHSDTDQVYFETGLKLSDLPSDLQDKARTGIPFSDLEELYSFLENYSS